MKRMTTLLACLAVMLLAATSAMAAALGPHMSVGATNPCKVCHDTAAGSPALRGWAGASAGPATGWGAKPISGLCYLCHSAGGGPLVGTPGHNMLANAYANNSHGYVTAAVPEAPEGSAQTGIPASGLPYTAAAILQIECTSCHNVHVATNRPFNQRAGYQLMCDECHVGRANNTSATTLPGTLHAYSSHPTQQVIADTARANLIPAATIAANLRVPLAAAPNYALGGHIQGADQVDCQTCHAVHGPMQGTAGNNDLLAIDNTTGANGSALCEGCHFGGIAGEQVGSVAAYLQSALGPGEFSDHPIDNLGNRTFYPTNNQLPVLWQTLGTPNLDRGAQLYFGGTGATPAAAGAPTCSSCHDTHGGIANTPLLRGPAPVQAFGAMDYNDWCFSCHTAAQVIPNNHHSVVGNLATSQLDCGDCHGAAGTVNMNAHNGFWNFAVDLSATNSLFCEGCHNPLNPTLFVAGGLKGGQTYNAATLPARHGTIRDAADATGANNHQMNIAAHGTNLNLDITPDWTTAVPTNTAVAGYVSEWGAGGNTPICESCHNIIRNGVNLPAAQTLTAGWQANLLLAPYEDDNVGEAAGEQNDFYGNATIGAGPTSVNMCRACHRGNGVTAPVTFVHNPSAHTEPSTSYTYAAGTEPYGRSTNTILTDEAAACPNRSTADAAGAPGGVSYPAANQVDCDSCHRPHNADVDSLDAGAGRYLILEITDANWGSSICAQCHNTDIQCN